MSNTLLTADPNRLEYANGLLSIEVLGGIKTEGMDRMRATLKVGLKDSPRPPVRHNLDLYNDNQLERLIRKIAERLEIGTSVIAASLSALTGELETYRLELLKLEQSHLPQARALTEGERAAAIANLQAPGLITQTLEDLQSTGIQGEADNSLILLLAMSSRKCPDPLSVVCLAKSGAGKSYLMEKVAGCIPDEDKREHTQFSGNSFYYYRREEIRGKVFLIEDLEGAQEVLFPIRELQTKKRISKTVTVKDKAGQLRTVTLVVEGPVSVIGCTTREKLYEDNANRAILIYLDNSKEQDERIMDYQKRQRAGLADSHAEHIAKEKLQNMQRMLCPVKVVNPYAPLISLPKELFKPRRTLPLLLSFIEAVTFYHQYQREQKAEETTGEVYIETTPADIACAFQLLQEVLFRKGDELSGAAREFYEWLQGWHKTAPSKSPPPAGGETLRTGKQKALPTGEGLGGAAGAGFYAADIRKDHRIHPRTLNRYLQELQEYGLLEIAGGNKHRTGYSYKLAGASNYAGLQQSINAQITQVLENIRQAHEAKQQPQAAAPVKRKTGKPVSHQLDKAVAG